MLRALKHYWPVNLAVVLAAAVNTAVLVGALLVGDSVRGSLRDLTLDRLGSVDLALVAERFFREELSGDSALAAVGHVTPAILLRGSVTNAESRDRASSVNVHGIDERFVDLLAESAASPSFDAGESPSADDFDFVRRQGQVFPSVVVNQTLAAELAAGVGDQLLLRFRLGSEVPRDTLLGSREVEDLVGSVRAVVTAVVADRGIGRFGLSPHQALPLNAYLSLSQLQRSLEQPGNVNALLISRPGSIDSGDSRTDAGEPPDSEMLAAAEAALRRSLTLDDFGLQMRRVAVDDARLLEIQSAQFVLRDATVQQVEQAAIAAGGTVQRTQAYLANQITWQSADGERNVVPYSMIAAIDPSPGGAHGDLRRDDGEAVAAIGDDEILLNRWAAAELDLDVAGPSIGLSYYVVGLDEELRTESASFRLAGIVEMAGLAADASLTPEYPGIEGVENIADWDPPFPVDLGLVRPQDEDYWDEHRGTPKAFISQAAGRQLWSTRYGSTTAVRIAPPVGATFGDFEEKLRADITSTLEPVRFGFRLTDVKGEGLAAAAGATDFRVLFISFSFFIIASASMIAALLFGLGVEQRAGEIGLLTAVGYQLRQVRRQLLAEGAVLAGLGALLGIAAGVAYARLMLFGLRTVWQSAVGTPLMFLHVEPLSLASGGMISVVVVLISIWLTVRRLGRVPPTRLLAGSVREVAAGQGSGQVGGRSRFTMPAAVGGALIGLGLLAFSLATGNNSSPGLAFGIGASLLISGLASFVYWCRGGRGNLERSSRSASKATSLASAAAAMAARNTGWNPGRSTLSVALVACAAFVIVTVAGNVRDPVAETGTVDSGAGGYSLLATTDVAVHHDLNREESRFELGFPSSSAATLDGVAITSLRVLPGDDASCLNLYQPRRPRVVGIPDHQIERGGFRFAGSLVQELVAAVPDPPTRASEAATGGAGASAAVVDPAENPWLLLHADLGDNVIPAIADANSARWILHLGLGDEIELDDEKGGTVRLRLVALLAESIFRSEVLVSESNLLAHFPSQAGFSYFLIDAPQERAAEVATLLEDTLSPFGFDATSSSQRIADFLSVQNTYLATFQLLGGLGLLLGTVGMAVVLVRSVIERRGELATLRAFGFRRAFLSRVVLTENAFLLLAGLAVGSLSALLATMPRYLAGVLPMPWRSLAVTFAAVLVVGLLASVAAVAAAARVPLLSTLKADK